MKDFDIEKLERKNIYHVPDMMFENIQNKVMAEVKSKHKAPIFKMNWAYAAAASLAIIFGVTFMLNNGNDSVSEKNTTVAVTTDKPMPESEKAYETLKSDITSVDRTYATEANPAVSNAYSQTENGSKSKAANNAVQVNAESSDKQMTEYLEAFSNSEIAELSKNSTQDVYLDLYN